MSQRPENPESLFRRLLEDVADDREVDWDGLASQQPALGRRLQHLRWVAEVARGHRPPVPSREPGQRPAFTWGHLQVFEPLGEGTFGEVYRARDPALDREVALKLRRPGPSRQVLGGQAFLEEARRLARLRHPNVVTVHGVDVHDGRVGLWTDLLEGRTLEDWIQHEGPRSAREAALVGLDLCRALAALHSLGLVHADLKTANVMRERGGRIVLVDFGAVTEAHRAAVRVIGTPMAMAPELLRGAPPEPRSDLYSLGVLLYRLVTGRWPVEAEEDEELLTDGQRRGGAPLVDLRPDLPRCFVAVVERALEPDPERRFRSAGEMERALAAAVAEGEVAAGADAGRESGEGIRAAETRSRPRLARPLAAAIGLLLVAGGVLGWRLFSPHPEGEPLAVAESHAEGVDELPRPVPAPEVEPASGSASPPSLPAAAIGEPAPSLAHPATRPQLRVEAVLFRDSDGRLERLGRRGEVTLGDRLFLELASSETIHAYVVNEDLHGSVYLLFPLPALDLVNPLPANSGHRLPGARRGVQHDWVVTTPGGQEHFLVVASRHRLLALEEAIASLEAAQTGRPVGEARDLAEELFLRGVGGLTPASEASSVAGGYLDRVERLLASEPEHADIWIGRFSVRNSGG